jgi:hypothetical protein
MATTTTATAGVMSSTFTSACFQKRKKPPYTIITFHSSGTPIGTLLVMKP